MITITATTIKITTTMTTETTTTTTTLMIDGDKKVVSKQPFASFHCNPESIMPKLH